MDKERSDDTGSSSTSGVYRTVTDTRLAQLQRELESAHARVGAFRDNIVQKRAGDSDADAGWLALREVDVAHEELRVAQEELHAQADELVALRTALDAERRRYAELFELAPDAYVVTDAHGCVLEANRCAGVLFRLDPVFLAGKPLASFVAAEDRARFRDLITLISAARTEAQFRIVPRKGEQVWVSVAAQGTTRGSHGPPAIRWLMRDTSAAKVEERLRLERDHALNARLRELEEVAGQLPAPALRQQVLGEVAHELRSPLGSIAGWLHILTQEHGHAELTRRALMSMSRSVRVLATLIEDLVQHSRFERSRTTEEHTAAKISVKAFNLLRLVIEVVEDLRPLAELKGVELSCSGHPYRVEVLVDAARLQQVFRNVMGNAIKFTRPGGRVKVGVTVGPQRVVVSVVDTGRGIPRESLEAIFDPFVQLDKQEPNGGMGLGLSIARRIAELHGGTVTADSPGPGQGATFRVTLPLTTLN